MSTTIETIHAVESDFKSLSSVSNRVAWREESEFALQAFNRNSTLWECNPVSVQESIKNVATIGLSLNPALGYAYLVPESIKIGTSWVKVCQLRLSFQGLLKLATDSGAIKLAKAEIVRSGDEFSYNGPMEMPSHKISNPFDDAARGEPVGVYCIAITHEDRVIVDIMSWSEVGEIEAAAKTKAVWRSWKNEMAKKAIIKRAYKQWPKTPQAELLGKAIAIINESEGSEDNPAMNQETADEILQLMAITGAGDEKLTRFCSQESGIKLDNWTDANQECGDKVLIMLKQRQETIANANS